LIPNDHLLEENNKEENANLEIVRKLLRREKLKKKTERLARRERKRGERMRERSLEMMREGEK
jgi:hypothetical protein